MEEKKRRRVELYVIAVVGVVALLLFFGLRGEDNLITGGTTTLIGGGEVKGEEVSKNLEISTNLSSLPVVEMKKKVIAGMEFGLADLSTVFYVGKGVLDLEGVKEAKIRLEGFEGDFKLEEGKITLKGKVDKIFVNEVGIKKEGEVIFVSTEGLVFGYLKMGEISLEPFSYTTSGVVELNEGKISIKVEEELVKMGEFKGRMEISEGVFSLKGEMEKLVVGGVEIS